VGYDLSVAPQNRRNDEDDAWQASISSGLLHMKASRIIVSQSGIKTGRGAMVCGARGTIVEIT
jgi:hypothetical protein